MDPRKLLEFTVPIESVDLSKIVLIPDNASRSNAANSSKTAPKFFEYNIRYQATEGGALVPLVLKIKGALAPFGLRGEWQQAGAAEKKKYARGDLRKINLMYRGRRSNAGFVDDFMAKLRARITELFREVLITKGKMAPQLADSYLRTFFRDLHGGSEKHDPLYRAKITQRRLTYDDPSSPYEYRSLVYKKVDGLAEHQECDIHDLVGKPETNNATAVICVEVKRIMQIPMSGMGANSCTSLEQVCALQPGCQPSTMIQNELVMMTYSPARAVAFDPAQTAAFITRLAADDLSDDEDEVPLPEKSGADAVSPPPSETGAVSAEPPVPGDESPSTAAKGHPKVAAPDA